MTGSPRRIGIIGGSGVSELDAIEDASWRTVMTPFGAPSDDLLEGTIDGVPVVFLPRHGRGHPLPPSDVNARANVYALKQLGVTDVLSLSAVGSLCEDLPPGTFVLVDQFIDRTFARVKSFFGPGLVAHVSVADPVCSRLSDTVAAAAVAAGVAIVRGGTYLVMEGPQFSTRAESELYRSWGCSVIGMTAMPEAKLAREAELCYATVAMVTDFDSWHDDHDHVTVEQVVGVLRANADTSRALAAAAVAALGGEPAQTCPAGCDRALDHALITHERARDHELERRLGPLLARATDDEPGSIR